MQKHLSRVFRIIIIVIVISDVVIIIIIVLAVSSVCQRLPQAQAQARGDCVAFLPGCGHLQVANQMAYDICDPLCDIMWKTCSKLECNLK